MVEHRTGTPLTQVPFPGVARDFSPRVNSQCRLYYGLHTSSCAIPYINTCAHVKNPAVHVKIQWIMETLKHLVYTIGWVTQLCQSWLSPGKATQISNGKKSQWDNTVVKQQQQKC